MLQMANPFSMILWLSFLLVFDSEVFCLNHFV